MTSFAFRGQFQRAIRAPNIGDLYGGLQLNFQTLTDPARAGIPTSTQAVRDVCIATGVPAASVFTGRRAAGQHHAGSSPVAIRICRKRARTRAPLGVVFTPIDSLMTWS